MFAELRDISKARRSLALLQWSHPALLRQQPSALLHQLHMSACWSRTFQLQLQNAGRMLLPECLFVANQQQQQTAVAACNCTAYDFPVRICTLAFHSKYHLAVPATAAGELLAGTRG
jgi:hypothetical protein